MNNATSNLSLFFLIFIIVVFIAVVIKNQMPQKRIYKRRCMRCFKILDENKYNNLLCSSECLIDSFKKIQDCQKCKSGELFIIRHPFPVYEDRVDFPIFFSKCGYCYEIYCHAHSDNRVINEYGKEIPIKTFWEKVREMEEEKYKNEQ